MTASIHLGGVRTLKLWYAGVRELRGFRQSLPFPEEPGSNCEQLGRTRAGRWKRSPCPPRLQTCRVPMASDEHPMHGSLRNLTCRFRLSTDTRYQRASDPVDERWVGEDPKAHYA